MSTGYHIVVCGSVVPDPLQTLEPTAGPSGPALKNEMMLPAVLDPWAAHALYEASHLAGRHEGSRIWLVSLGPRAKLQQLMMKVAQKARFDLVAVDGSASGFTEPHEVAGELAQAIDGIADLDRSRLLLFGGCASASRDAGVTMQILGEQLGITHQFHGVDRLTVTPEGALRIHERVERGKYQVSECAGPPVVVAWATGSLPEPPNNPQVGMQNMRAILPAIQKARTTTVGAEGTRFLDISLPKGRRDTRVVKDVPVDTIAQEIADWIRG